MTSHNYEYIAIDIAKDSLQLKTDSISRQLTYDDGGLGTLRKILKTHTHPVVVCEATGGYERKLMHFLFKHQISVALLNPARVRSFARSEGQKAKTDPIDAQMLLRFAQQRKLAPTKAPAQQQIDLADLLDRRGHLKEQLAREKNRLQKCPSCIRASIQKMIKFVEKEIESIEDHIRELVSDNQEICAQVRLMTQVRGVGEVTSLSRNQIVALAGLAPYNQDSGKRQGKRRIQERRAKVRKALYMASPECGET